MSSTEVSQILRIPATNYAFDNPIPFDIYIAGPMTGYEDWNFEAFNQAADELRRQGLTVMNPADNYDGRKDLEWHHYMRAAIRQVSICREVVVLPGWEDSKGARLEVHIAHVLGMTVWEYKSLERILPTADTFAYGDPALAPESPSEANCEPLGNYHFVKDDDPENVWGGRWVLNPEPPEGILTEADRLINGPRQEDYGHPFDNFSQIGRMWAAILNVEEVTPEQVALMMIATKISRETNRPKRDNRVDMAGYTGTYEMVVERREELEK